MPACGPAPGFPARRSCPIAHNDLDDLRALLRERRTGHGKTLILTDGVFSMDGDLAPLPALGRLAREYDCLADGGRCPWHRRRRPGPRFDLRDRHRGRRAAADGNAVEGDRRLWRLSLRLGAGDRADEEPRPHPHLFHRPAARRSSPRPSRRSISSPPIPRSPLRRSPRRAPSPPAPACRRRRARSCR